MSDSRILRVIRHQRLMALADLAVGLLVMGGTMAATLGILL